MKNETALKSKTVFNADKNIRRHQVEWFAKITMALSCLIFFLIGAPLGAIIRKGGLGMPVVVSVFTFIVYYILESSGTKLAKAGEIPVWWGCSISTVVLAPLGVLLTYHANKDSGVFNADLYKNAFRWLLAQRTKRNLTIKEVIIDDPDYASLNMQLSKLSTACNTYRQTSLAGRWPNYISLFTGDCNHSRTLLVINARYNDIVAQLSNSKRQDIINLLNMQPVISVNSHVSPFPRKWQNTAVGLCLPVGILFYARACFFRQRLQTDLEQIIKTNNEIQYIINERILK
jgi:lipopolysaccharide export system permease protein